MTSKTTNKFSPEVWTCAVQLVLDHEGEHGSRWAAVVSISTKIGCTPQTFHEWVKKAEIDSDRRFGVPSDVSDRPKSAGTREPRASPGQRDPAQGVGLFCPGGARPPVQAMIAFIDDHREVHGVEPICKVLPIAPSTYHAHAAKRANPGNIATRARRDMALKPEITRVFAENFEVHGVRKVWRQFATRELRRCQLHRRAADARHGFAGRDPGPACPDYDQRHGGAVSVGPRQSPTSRAVPKCVVGLGFYLCLDLDRFVYVAFVIDVDARRIVGWRTSRTAHASFVLDAHEQALHDRQPTHRGGLVHHSEWVDWFNNRRLLEPIGNIPPAEAEERYYAMMAKAAVAA